MSLEISQVNFIADIKQKVRDAQYEALKVVNTQLINLYWEIGKSISEKQSENWGKQIVPALSKELQNEFPGIGGFSTTNLWLMAQFYSEYHEVEILLPLVGEISWTGWLNNFRISHRRNKYFRRTLLIQPAERYQKKQILSRKFLT